MDTKPQREDAVLSLNVAVKAIGLVENISGITPAKAAFGSVSAILVMIRVGSPGVHAGRLLANALIQDSMIDEVDYVDLGLACADVCSALGQGLKERRADELSRPVLEAIKWLTTWVDATEVYSVRNPCSVPYLSITGPRRRSRERFSSGVVNEA